MSVKKALGAVAALLCAACSDQQPFSPSNTSPVSPRFASAAITLACPSGWTQDMRGTAVLRCKRPRPWSSVPEYVLFVNLKARARVEMAFDAASLSTLSTPSPDFQKRTIGEWWQASQARPGAVCAVSGTFFETRDGPTTQLSFPLKSGGLLRSTGVALTEPGARILSIRNDEAWINTTNLATTAYQTVSTVLNEANMLVAYPVQNSTLSASKGRHYVGLKDLDNDNFAETIFFYVSPGATEREAFDAVQSIGYRSIIQLDGSGSAQLNCGAKTLLPGDYRKIPQVFFVSDARTPIHRSYRSSVPDHLYGHDPREGIPYGYVLEQANYFWLDPQSGVGSVPVYRCLWGGNRHLVTRSSNCEGAGSPEAVLGYGLGSQAPGSVPMHRLFNPRSGDHLYTTSETERRNVAAAGWTYEGVTAYVWAAP